MRIAVFGVGGVGGYFGGRLAHAGEDVVFIARGEHLRAIRDSGLRVESVAGDFIVQPAQASADPSAVGPVDAVLLGVKAWQVPEVASALIPLLGPETCVVPLQNGIEAPAQLAAALGEQHVLGGLCRIVCSVVAPGHVRHVGADPYVAFGELDHRPSDRVERLRQAFMRAGVPAEVPADIHAAMWAKFMFVVSWGSMGAVTRATLGVLRTLPETRRLLEQAMSEIADVARAHGIMLADDIITRTLAMVDAFPAHGTASMQRDIMDGRPSELDAQTGAVVRLGSAAHVATPLYNFMYACLLPQELRSRGQV